MPASTAMQPAKSRRHSTGDEPVYFINTMEVPSSCVLENLDWSNSCREADCLTVKLSTPERPCPIQLWEVYAVAAILLLQPSSALLMAHVAAICRHRKRSSLCEAVLQDHLLVDALADSRKEQKNLYRFFERFLVDKFKLRMPKLGLQRYIGRVLRDPRCGQSAIPRAFLAAPHVQAMLLNSQFFDGELDLLGAALRDADLPVNDIVEGGEGQASALPSLRGSAMFGSQLQLTSDDPEKEEKFTKKLTGYSPRGKKDQKKRSKKRRRKKKGAAGGSTDDGDFVVDAEHPRVSPLGVTMCELYVLLRAMSIGEKHSSKKFKGYVVGYRFARGRREGHLLAAAVLVDLYMRGQIDVHHWTLSKGGEFAVPYRVRRTKGLAHMEHFLDEYIRDVETIFHEMLLPGGVGELPIWHSLEEKGIVENHRTCWEKATKVDVWDFARPDLLLDLKEGYFLAARVVYDDAFAGKLDGNANDTLMFMYLAQQLFEVSPDVAAKLMANMLNGRCPPFQTGELSPPKRRAHAASVCSGLIDRGARVAMGRDVQLAQEAAQFNMEAMERLETQFFLSPKIWASFDTDQDSSLSLREFKAGMRKLNLFQEFRHEKVPHDVLLAIISDLAERLFKEVDVNGDGDLTLQELQEAFTRRREELLQRIQRRKLSYQIWRAFAVCRCRRRHKHKTHGPHESRGGQQGRPSAQSRGMPQSARLERRDSRTVPSGV